MSTSYNLEPQPTASAIIHTSQGEIAVELFAKQTPLTCRNFLQLSLDGYYDNTIFHRLVPGFILQGGDPTGTGHGGESIYDGGALGGDLDPWPMDQRKGQNEGLTGVNFKDEFHSRLKFNRRGLLGMANEGTLDTNGSQFFFTLGKADELTGKNTLFGRVAGDTIYNLMKMGEAEVEEGGERPLYPVTITGVEILINPFDDMRKREWTARPVQTPKGPTTERKQKKRKAAKQLLSFGDEEEEEEDNITVVKKAKFDTRVVMDASESQPTAPEKPAKTSLQKASRPTTKEKPAAKEQRANIPRSPRPQARPKKEEPPTSETLDGLNPEPEFPRKSRLERMNEEIAAVKASMRRSIPQAQPSKLDKRSAFEQLIPETSIRGRKGRTGTSNPVSKDDQEALDLLNAFRSKLQQAPEEKVEESKQRERKDKELPDAQEASGASDEVCDLHFIANCQSCQAWDKVENKEDSDDEGWMSHTLDCAADKLGKDLSCRKKAEDELVVIDPLAKARTLKGDRRAAREPRAGASGRAWDERRNERR